MRFTLSMPYIAVSFSYAHLLSLLFHTNMHRQMRNSCWGLCTHSLIHSLIHKQMCINWRVMRSAVFVEGEWWRSWAERQVCVCLCIHACVMFEGYESFRTVTLRGPKFPLETKSPHNINLLHFRQKIWVKVRPVCPWTPSWALSWSTQSCTIHSSELSE